MQKILLSAICACGMVACASTGVSQSIPTPQQLLTDFCPIVNADLKVLSESPLLSSQQQSVVANIASINSNVCAAGAQIDVSDLQSLDQTAFPALIALVSAIPGLPDQQAILLGLTLAQPILAQVAQSVAAQAAVPAAASSAK